MSRGLRRNGLFEALPGRVLRAVDHAALEPLIGDAARAHLLSVMDELDAPVQTVCYEARLGRGDPRVDIAVVLLPMRTAAVEDVLGMLGRRHLGDPAWRRCLGFLAEWSHPASPFAAHIPFACVAFDLPGDRAPVPVPGVSLCIDREFFTRQRGLQAAAPPPAAELMALVDACHGRLRGAPLASGARPMLERCLSSGDGAIPKHVSFMLSRTPPTCKLDLRVPVDGVAALLRRIEWPGPIPGVVTRIRELAPSLREVQLNLVLRPELDASLEVELLVGMREGGTEERDEMLRQLIGGGHCDAAKAEVLRRAWARPVSRDRGGVIVARIWYLKVRFDGDRIAETKAYLGLMPRVFCDPRTVGADEAREAT
jgi:hypothetical protein